MTWVTSWQTPDTPPNICVCFKADGDRILADIDAPPWMLVHSAPKGPYRVGHMFDALEWGLEPATCSEESILVMLEWFAAHLCPELQELIAEMGHVVVYHGGGVTGLEQVNDTHLHALLQRRLEQLEVRLN